MSPDLLLISESSVLALCASPVTMGQKSLQNGSRRLPSRKISPFNMIPNTMKVNLTSLILLFSAFSCNFFIFLAPTLPSGISISSSKLSSSSSVNVSVKESFICNL